MNIQNLVLDINKKTFQTITANVGEVASRFVRINIVDKSIPMNLTGVTASLYAEKPDSKKVFNNVTIEDKKNGIILAELTSQILAVEGLVKLTLLLVKDGAKLCSKQFLLNVDGSIVDDKAIESTNEFTALANALGRVNNIDSRFEEVGSQLEHIASKGTTVEVLERVTKEEIDRQVKDGTIANLTIQNNSITNSKLKDNTITDSKISNIGIGKINEVITLSEPSINLFNKENATLGGYFDKNGDFLQSTAYGSSDYIPVKYNEVISHNMGKLLITFYDDNYNVIPNEEPFSDTFVIPTGVSFVKVPFYVSRIDTVMIIKGNIKDIPSTYVPYSKGKYKFDDCVEVIPSKNTISKSMLSDELKNIIEQSEDVGILKTQINLLEMKINEILSNGGVIQPDGVDMFIMSGQSNMQGQSEKYLEFSVVEGKAYEYRLLSDTLTQVKHPFGEDIGSLLLGAHKGWSSISPHFADAYYKQSGRTPLMVGCAKGATKVSEWQKGSSGGRYEKMIEKANNAVACFEREMGKPVEGKYFVWLQGESDGISNVTKDTYKEQFLKLWNNVKADCGATKCFIIRVGKFHSYNVYPIMKAQEELAKEHDDIIMTTRITGYLEYPSQNPINPTLQDGSSSYYAKDHYTCEGYKLVGETSGKNIADYIRFGITPVLEKEPYLELEDDSEDNNSSPLSFDYEFNFRKGYLKESESDITSSTSGTFKVNDTNISVDSLCRINLQRINLATGTHTITFTGALSPTSNSTGSLITEVDSNPNKEAVFIYKKEKIFRLVASNEDGSFNSENMDWDISDMFNDGTIYNMNNFTIQKNIDKWTLYINGVNRGEKSSTATQFSINGLFSGTTYPYSGQVEYFRVCSGIKTPQEIDIEFFK